MREEAMKRVQCYFIGGPLDLTKKTMEYVPRVYYMPQIGDCKDLNINSERVVDTEMRHAYIGSAARVASAGVVWVYLYDGINDPRLPYATI